MTRPATHGGARSAETTSGEIERWLETGVALAGRQATLKVTQNLSLWPHVKEALQQQAADAGMDVSAYVTSLVMEREKQKEQKQ